MEIATIDSDLFVELEGVEAADGNYVPPAAGDYRLEVVKFEATVSKQEQRMHVYDIKVVALSNGETTTEAGKKFRDYRTFDKEFAKQRYKNFLQALGVKPNESPVGRQFLGTLTLEESSGLTKDGEEKTFVNARLRNEKPLTA